MVLSYLSDAAGFIIVQDTHVNGTVTVVGQHLTQDEAVNLLNTELNRNNYAAIRDGRTLTIVDKNDAKTRNIPVKTGNRPGDIPNDAEIATWIIPIRFVEARQLVSDLSTLFRRRRRSWPTRPATRWWSPTPSPTSGIWPKSSRRWTTAPRRRRKSACFV